MNDQLVLLADEAPRDATGGDTADGAMWALDEHTRQIGRRGVALARQALRQAATRAA